MREADRRSCLRVEGLRFYLRAQALGTGILHESTGSRVLSLDVESEVLSKCPGAGVLPEGQWFGVLFFRYVGCFHDI